MEKGQFPGARATAISWDIPPREPKLENNEVHVWLVQLEESKAQGLTAVLSDDEMTRAVRYRLDKDRKRFIVARGFLRILLGKYLETNPDQLSFEYSEFGKPSISANFHSDIKFNLSHSGDFALYAFTRNREVGIDLELIKTDFLEETVISQCLTLREKSFLGMILEGERESFFFECWTRKEAYLKASGSGFLIQPNQIETSKTGGSYPEFVEGITAAPGLFFSFLDLPKIQGYAASLAVLEKNLRLKSWQFNW